MKKHLLLIAAAVCCNAVPAQDTLRLTQAECRQLALLHNEELQKATNALQQARLDKDIAFSAYLPKVDGMLSGTYMFPDMNLTGMELQMRGMYTAGISVTQPLYAGGKIVAGNKLARIGRESAAETLRKTRMEVIAEADQAYWNYIAVGCKVRMLEAYRTQMDTLYSQTRTALATGMATDNQLLRIGTKRSEIDYQLQKVRHGADLCRLSLCHVLGKPFDTPIEPADILGQAVPPGQLDESIAFRPELQLLRHQVAAREQQVKSARGDILPQIGLSAGYAYYGNVKINAMTTDALGNYVPYTQKLDDGIGLVMASVSIPLFHWGEGLKRSKSTAGPAERTAGPATQHPVAEHRGAPGHPKPDRRLQSSADSRTGLQAGPGEPADHAQPLYERPQPLDRPARRPVAMAAGRKQPHRSPGTIQDLRNRLPALHRTARCRLSVQGH